ncbi:MAG: GFA family protein [Rhodovibrionaceae bacterium]
MKIEGGCHCGAIAYSAEVDPKDVIVCHCTDCQTLSGSAFRSVAFARKSSFTLTRGAPTVYVKRADSGRGREQTFCATCGTPIYSSPLAADYGEEDPLIGLRVGAIKQRDRLPPKAQAWCGSAQAWLGDIADLDEMS